MTDMFRMDKPQPRLFDETVQGVIGKPLDRPEGLLKVTGRAPYAAEVPEANMVHGVLVRSTITRGRLTGIDKSALEGLSGILGVIRSPEFVRNSAQGMANEAPIQPEDHVAYFGQPMALVVAETFEAARDGAHRLRLSYETEHAEIDPTTTSEIDTKPDSFGDLDSAMAQADVTIDQKYSTPGQVSAAMEPHASIAWWEGDNVTLRGSYQMLRFNRNELADSLGIDPENVRILSPYVGGGFGSKLGIGSEAVAAAIAARELGRPVRVVMSRQHVFDMVLRRSETHQRLRLAAKADGTLLGIGHEDRVSNLPGEEFSEPTAMATHFMYGGENRLYNHEIARIHRTPSGSVRAPGEAVGMLALESAMDELAEVAGIDPVELRLRNLPEKHPEKGVPFSSRRFEDCLREGAKEFGWENRTPTASRREGDWFIGCGMSGAGRANMLVPSEARVTLEGDRAIVETDMTDIGTGSYAILTQIAAELLGLPMDRVETRLGDTRFPGASGSGGSVGAGSSGSSVFLAAKKIRARLAEAMGCAEEDLTLQDGIARSGNIQKPLSELAATAMTEEGGIKPGAMGKEFFQAGFGAHFVEIGVNAITGEARVRRMLGVFSAGRILNEKTATSQCIGGMVWGLGAALTEELQHDPRTGGIVSRDLANYHVASHADVPMIDVRLLPERDDQANPMQAKGIGELGISGAGAAVTNAIYNACGVRIRDFPATPDKIIAGLEALGR
ncbi:xanthine dehydrogenase, molybdenum binding subunit apoprotein [Poseidonocella pacifica]|uniref:Xanthine dehydrogenase, molybdenum binding subunit apoprotein n=1 Tax=Poseidonocella pacifica TaxID=871651 RepID=A0A1I0VK48_9RHOB|nr:xanthine dehydrogenase family protein molybdopterin-binding subunit [Poseidonocella pacifica]SFA76702.1 xanthine dehydrogenase, molybdenum binding subunit apoprotein [Poseidonocella pacifica]